METTRHPYHKLVLVAAGPGQVRRGPDESNAATIAL